MPRDKGLTGIVDRNGKGDKRRPKDVADQTFIENGTRTFGEDWAIPPVLRRRRQQEHDDASKPS